MTICKDWFISFVVAALLVCNVALIADEGLEYTIDPPTIEPGTHALLTVRLPKTGRIQKLLAEKSLEAFIQDDFLMKKKEIQVLNKGFHDEKEAFVWTYEFTAYKVGKLNLPPVEVQFGPFSFSTESKSIEISTSRQKGDEELRSAFGAVRPPFPWRIWIKWILIAILGGGASAALFAFFPKRKSKLVSLAPQPIIAPVEEEPLTWLKRRLEELRGQLQGAEERPEFVDELTGIVRQYFERSTSNPARSWTTQEFQARFNQDEKAVALGKIFERCDQFKFQLNSKSGAKELAVNCLKDTEQILL